MARTRWWMVLAAGGLLLAACRSDGERGEAAPQDRAPSAPGARPAAGDRAQAGASADDAARVLAAARALAQAEVDAGKLAQGRASSPDVKDYAMRAVAESQSTLDAISDLAKAKKIDLEAAAIQNDPLLKADRDAARENIDRLRALSGTAFDAAYMTAQRPSQSLIAQLAQAGPQVTRDPDVGNVLRTLGQQARDRASKAISILPKACGGERPGWGGAG